MKKKLKWNKIIAVVCIVPLLVLGVKVVRTSGHLLRPITVDDPIKSIETYKEFPDNCFQLLVLGSSRAWSGIDTMLLEAKYGIPSFNSALSWQHVNTSKLFLKTILQNQSPKTVVLETDCIISGNVKNEVMKGETYYTRGVGNLSDKVAYLTQCFEDHSYAYLSYFIPSIAFHENWKEIDENSVKDNCSERDFLQNRGFMSREKSTEVEHYTGAEQESIPEDGLQTLQEIEDICNERGIQLVLCTLPVEEAFAYGDAFDAYAKEHNIPYLNMDEKYDEIGFDGKVDFHGDEHLNKQGADKATDYLYQYLKDGGFV